MDVLTLKEEKMLKKVEHRVLVVLGAVVLAGDR